MVRHLRFWGAEGAVLVFRKVSGYVLRVEVSEGSFRLQRFRG